MEGIWPNQFCKIRDSPPIRVQWLQTLGLLQCEAKVTGVQDIATGALKQEPEEHRARHTEKIISLPGITEKPRRQKASLDPPTTHMAEPGQWPAGSRVTVKVRGGRSWRASSAMATGYSMGRGFRKGERLENSGSFRSRDRVTSEQNRLV